MAPGRSKGRQVWERSQISGDLLVPTTNYDFAGTVDLLLPGTGVLTKLAAMAAAEAQGGQFSKGEFRIADHVLRFTGREPFTFSGTIERITPLWLFDGVHDPPRKRWTERVVEIRWKTWGSPVKIRLKRGRHGDNFVAGLAAAILQARCAAASAYVLPSLGSGNLHGRKVVLGEIRHEPPYPGFPPPESTVVGMWNAVIEGWWSPPIPAERLMHPPRRPRRTEEPY
jgi:hypothetical protein